MSVRPAIFYTIAFFILLPIYFWIQPSIKPTSALEQKAGEPAEAGNGIDAITVTSGSESLRFQKDQGRQVLQPRRSRPGSSCRMT